MPKASECSFKLIRERNRGQHSAPHISVSLANDILISRKGLPFVEGEVENIKFSFLIDTGAEKSIIDLKAVGSVPREKVIRATLKDESVGIRGINGSITEYEENLRVEISYGGQVCGVTVACMQLPEHMEYDGILGMDVVNDLYKIIDGVRRSVKRGSTHRFRYKDHHDECLDVTPIEIKGLDSLNLEERKLVYDIFGKYPGCFASSIKDLTGMMGELHSPVVDQTKPVSIHQYRIPECYLPRLKELTKSYLRAGIIEESSSAWNSPIHIVEKQSGEIRMTLDLRRVNDLTAPPGISNLPCGRDFE
ncbi:uncharacterized protein [Centruroides vittatus]|uniref:uncharacterized protein n=1 Tax=Centruroides vittatus TaxID=120091 RepID=UPI0035102D5F